MIVTTQIQLPASEIAVGHCVNLNDCEQPCGKLIAVITQIDDVFVRCKYLNADRNLSSYNALGGMIAQLSGGIHRLTPIGLFGVRVMYQEGDEPFYWCEQVSSVSNATYRDGSPRQWQEFRPMEFNARLDVVKYCLKAISRNADKQCKHRFKKVENTTGEIERHCVHCNLEAHADGDFSYLCGSEWCKCCQ